MDLSKVFKPKKDALKTIKELDEKIKEKVMQIETFKGASFETIKFSYRGEPYCLTKTWDEVVRSALIEQNKKKIRESIQELEELIPGYEPDEDIKKILEE